MKKLNFKQHIDSAVLKINKSISVIKRLRYSLWRKSLVTIYKAFLRSLIDYGEIIYDQSQTESFCEKLESVQYKAIGFTMQSTSHNKIYQELELESLKSKRWCKRLSCMLKIMKGEGPNYSINFKMCIPTFNCKTGCFKYSLFPSTLNDWFNLDIR